MTILFVDASALVAIVNEEEGYAALLEALHDAARSITSPMALWETARATARIRDISFEQTSHIVCGLVEGLGIELVTVGFGEFAAAWDAHARYGKGVHPAGLNFGDCFAYACAMTNGAKLLYKGNDFALTDLA